jgi:hypothetical protein
MNKVNWTQLLVFGIVVLVVFLVGLSLIQAVFGSSSWGMMGPGMMQGWSMWGMGPGSYSRGGLVGGFFGVIFSIIGVLIPVGLLVLVILGCVWLVRNISWTTAPQSPSAACPDCGKSVAADWINCPHCGKEL